MSTDSMWCVLPKSNEVAPAGFIFAISDWGDRDLIPLTNKLPASMFPELAATVGEKNGYIQLPDLTPGPNKLTEEIERLKVCLKYAGLYAFCTKYLREKEREKT